MNFAEQLKGQLDIVRVVGEYVRLQKRGARYTALCPFHTEKSPSFNVNPALGYYYCFGCGAKGDILKFVQEMEQLTFPETLKLLAERNGIPMPARRERYDGENREREAALEIHEFAAEVFRDHLFKSQAASEARQYLAKRGLSQTAVEQFGIGYSDRSGSDLLRRCRDRFSPAELEASGLFAKRDDGSLYDRFRGRLMFPIHNESGKVIAFGGRALQPDEEPKYLNSPETTIYKKSLTLYNLHRAKEAVRKAGRVVLVEGYMDVIGVYGAGVRFVVASCGTALTPQQVRVMKRHSDNIVVNFDPDTAGANATERSIQILLDEGMHVRVLQLGGDKDPDDYIREHGADNYMDRVERAGSYFLWLADRARSKNDMSSAEGRMTGFQNVLLPAIRRISDRLERATVAAEVAEYLGIDKNMVLREFRRTPGMSNGPAVEQKVPTASPSHTERILLRSLVSSEDCREVLLPCLEASQTARRFTIWPIIQILAEMARDGEELAYGEIENRVAEPDRDLLSAAFFADSFEEVFSREQALAYARVLEYGDREATINGLRAQVKQAERSGDTAGALNLMQQLNSVEKGQKR